MGRAKKYLEYRIVITPDKRVGTNTRCFTAYVPVLGIAADGDTVEEARQNAENLVAFHLESLRKEEKTLPVECIPEEFVATARVAVPF